MDGWNKPLTYNENISIVRICEYMYVCMYVWSILPKLDIICNKLAESDIIAISEIHSDGIIVDIDLVLDDYDQPVRKDSVVKSIC